MDAASLLVVDDLWVTFGHEPNLVSAVKGASFDIHYLVQDPVTREDCVRATSHLAFVDEATGRVLRLTPEQKDRLAPYTRAHPVP